MNHVTPPMRTSSNFPFSICVLILNWGDLDDNGVGGRGTSGKIFGQTFTLTIHRRVHSLSRVLKMLLLCFWICCDLSWLFNEKENHIFKKRTPLPHCFYLQNALSYTMIPAEDLLNHVMDLLNLCLTSTYFHYNGNRYKQLHGTAMESPVSVVVAEIVMQNIEKRGL